MSKHLSRPVRRSDPCGKDKYLSCWNNCSNLPNGETGRNAVNGFGLLWTRYSINLARWPSVEDIGV